MSRIYGADVLSKLKTLLEESLNDMLLVIQTERSDVGLELVKKVNIGYFERQFPECLISMENSKLDQTSIETNINQVSEEWPVEVVVVFRDISDVSYYRQEYYIEALERLLNGYSDGDITWVLVDGTVRENMYTEARETFRVVGVSATVRTL